MLALEAQSLWTGGAVRGRHSSGESRRRGRCGRSEQPVFVGGGGGDGAGGGKIHCLLTILESHCHSCHYFMKLSVHCLGSALNGG